MVMMMMINIIIIIVIEREIEVRVAHGLLFSMLCMFTHTRKVIKKERKRSARTHKHKHTHTITIYHNERLNEKMIMMILMMIFLNSASVIRTTHKKTRPSNPTNEPIDRPSLKLFSYFYISDHTQLN